MPSNVVIPGDGEAPDMAPGNSPEITSVEPALDNDLEDVADSIYNSDISFKNLMHHRKRFGKPPAEVIMLALAARDGHAGRARDMLQDFCRNSSWDPDWDLFAYEEDIKAMSAALSQVHDATTGQDVD